MGILKDSPSQYREMGLAIVAVQVLTVIRIVTIDAMDAPTKRTQIIAVIFNTDDEVNGGLLGGETLIEIKNSHSSSPSNLNL